MEEFFVLVELELPMELLDKNQLVALNAKKLIWWMLYQLNAFVENRLHLDMKEKKQLIAETVN